MNIITHSQAETAAHRQLQADLREHQKALARADARSDAYTEELARQRSAFSESFARAYRSGDFNAPATFAEPGWTISEAALYALDVSPSPALPDPPSYSDAWAVILEAAQSGQPSAKALISRMAEASAYLHAKEPAFT